MLVKEILNYFDVESNISIEIDGMYLIKNANKKQILKEFGQCEVCTVYALSEDNISIWIEEEE